MRSVFVFSAFILLNAQAFANAPVDWWQIVQAGDGSVYYMSEKDISNEVDYNPQVWVHEDASKNKSVKHNFSKILLKINCRQKTIKFITSTDYNSNGNILSSFQSELLNSSIHIIPNSNGYYFAKWACPSGSIDF